MLQSVTDGDRSGRIWNLTDDLFDAYTGGVRLSLFQMHKFGTATRWKPAAYIDVSAGKFQNFEIPKVKDSKNTNAANCLKNPATCAQPPSKEDFIVTRNARMYIEARVVLKYIYLGFDINNGSGKDDVRFIAGVTVTLDKFLKR
jgi:hypothetical protein